ncbi:MAG: hypothetical protein ACRDIV_01875 [Ktedonobacteraceae bacterium]
MMQATCHAAQDRIDWRAGQWDTPASVPRFDNRHAARQYYPSAKSL